MTTNHNFIIGVTDTDSISFCLPDGGELSKERRAELLAELNSIMPEHIVFEDDGYYKKCIVLKAKNYILYDPTKAKERDRKQVKGSAFKSATKEPIVVQMMQELIEAMLHDKQDTLVSIYEAYVEKALNVKDINLWCSKRTITDKILAVKTHGRFTKDQLKLKGWRKNEIVVWEAVKDEELVSQGDRCYLYPAIIGQNVTSKTYKNGTTKSTSKPIVGLKLAEKWNNDHNVPKLLKRLFDTMKIFANILDINLFTNYSLIKNYKTLTEVIINENIK